MTSRGRGAPIDRRLALRVFIVNLLARFLWEAVSPYVSPPLHVVVSTVVHVVVPALVHVVIPTLVHVGLFTFG